MTANTFEETAAERLKEFLTAKFGAGNSAIEPLTPDASTREFFRVRWEDSPAIACVYGAPFVQHEQSYLDATNLFAVSGLPVAEMYGFSCEHGIIIHEDFGDNVLRPVLDSAAPDERENLINQAIVLIAEIQAATPRAFELGAIAAKLAFDFEKLSWELDFFTKHYFDSLRGGILNEAEKAGLKTELDAVSKELEARPRYLTHRDFHAANLMIDAENRLRIIDHQDARMGAATYDLVSLLLDRISAPPPSDWLEEKQKFFLTEREKIGLPPIEWSEFQNEFRLQTIQRCLKAIGTFSFQAAVRGKTNYSQYIAPMFEVVRQAAEQLDRFPNLQKIIREKVTK